MAALVAPDLVVAELATDLVAAPLELGRAQLDPAPLVVHRPGPERAAMELEPHRRPLEELGSGVQRVGGAGVTGPGRRTSVAVGWVRVILRSAGIDPAELRHRGDVVKMLSAAGGSPRR